MLNTGCRVVCWKSGCAAKGFPVDCWKQLEPVWKLNCKQWRLVETVGTGASPHHSLISSINSQLTSRWTTRNSLLLATHGGGDEYENFYFSNFQMNLSKHNCFNHRKCIMQRYLYVVFEQRRVHIWDSTKHSRAINMQCLDLYWLSCLNLGHFFSRMPRWDERKSFDSRWRGL